MRTVAILLKSGKVSKISFDEVTCYKIKDQEGVVKINKIFSGTDSNTINEITDQIAFIMFNPNMYVKFTNKDSAFVVNGQDISGVEISES